ncbi:MAG TPA: SDR family oxidoreductase [Bacteroidales bacterium]|nr:SDR family oxidoreductase [Bacteroidales bacterium]
MNKDSIVLITGANSGIGKATAINLAKTGAKVVMLCRNKDRGQIALQEVMKASLNQNVELMICDLGSLSNIREFTAAFKSRYPRLDVLINNAGVILPGYNITSDGFELQFGVNHIGHFLLTTELLPLLEAAGNARIINVSSGAHKIGKIYFDDVNLSKNYSFWRAYAQSKLANVLFTYSLAEKLKNSTVTVNCVHPGAVATQLGVNRDTGFGKWIKRILQPFFLTPEKGAETIIYLATQMENPTITGKYFVRKKLRPSSKLSYRKDLADRLWQLSEQMIESR